MLILHSCPPRMSIIYTDQRYYSHKINLLNCYCPLFPFLSSWGCININEMLKEKKKKKEKKGKWKKKGLPKQIITIQSQFRGKLWLCYTFESFHWILLLLNYVQMIEVHTYIWMCIAKLKCFLSLKIISSFNESTSWLFLLFSVSVCNVSEGKLVLPGTSLGCLGQEDISWLTELSAGTTQKLLVYYGTITNKLIKTLIPVCWDFWGDWKRYTSKIYFIRFCKNNIV